MAIGFTESASIRVHTPWWSKGRGRVKWGMSECAPWRGRERVACVRACVRACVFGALHVLARAHLGVPAPAALALVDGGVVAGLQTLIETLPQRLAVRLVVIEASVLPSAVVRAREREIWPLLLPGSRQSPGRKAGALAMVTRHVRHRGRRRPTEGPCRDARSRRLDRVRRRWVDIVREHHGAALWVVPARLALGRCE